jgi:hypothetical protein
MKLAGIHAGDELVSAVTNKCLKKGQVYRVQDDELGQGLYVFCDGGFHSIRTQKSADDFTPFIDKKGGWIGVDLDCTMDVYDGWRGPYHIGAPIPAMVERVKQWLKEGRDVRIFTARVTDRPFNDDGTPHDVNKVILAIDAWCIENIGQTLPITNVKDWYMRELWDDRCVQVRPNTGVTLADELEAVQNAEAKPKYPENA